MKKMLRILLAITTILIVFIVYQYRSLLLPFKTKSSTIKTAVIDNKVLLKKLENQRDTLVSYAIDNGYNTSICFLVDMSINCGKNRFFVYDMHKDSILSSGLVAHGSGNTKFILNPSFSNKINSGQTSLGKYKIGYQYTGKFGKAYKLYGLDSSNSNAFDRNVVLHTYSCVPNNEPYPLPICNSLGCPMVSYTFLEQLHPIIKATKKPILLWLYQ